MIAVDPSSDTTFIWMALITATPATIAAITAAVYGRKNHNRLNGQGLGRDMEELKKGQEAIAGRVLEVKEIALSAKDAADLNRLGLRELMFSQKRHEFTFQHNMRHDLNGNTPSLMEDDSTEE